MSLRHPAIISSDGFIDPETLGDITLDNELRAPTMHGHMVVPLHNDFEFAHARSVEEQHGLDVIGKSGHSRVHMTVERRDDEGIVFESRSRDAIVPVTVTTLRNVEPRRTTGRDDMLTVLRDLVKEKRREVNVGRLAAVRPEDQIGKGEVLKAIQEHKLFFHHALHPEKFIQEDGTIELPLEDVTYLFCGENFDTDAMRDVIRYGKHGLGGLQERVDGLPRHLRGRQAFVGGMKASLGPYTAIIDKETNKPDIIHLAARILDGVRTTGITILRQVELFNRALEAVCMQDLRIRMRLYHATSDVQEMWRNITTPRTIETGVSFSDVVELQKHPERMYRIMDQVAPTRDDEGPYAFLLGRGRMREVHWLEHPEFQKVNLQKVNTKFAAADPDYCISGENVPHFARPITSRLPYVGREQNEGGMCASWGFPEPETMQQMLTEGTGIFVAHDLRVRPDAYGPTPIINRYGSDNEARPPANDVYFDGELFNAFQHLHHNGARFFLVRHACEDALAQRHMPREIMEWHERGVWVRPSERERFEKIDTVIAMYGSHADGMRDTLEQQLPRFSLRMKRLFQEKLAYIHGKGPGVMHIADQIARNLVTIAKNDPEYADDITENIFRIGVGISAEKIGQSPNFDPPAHVDFNAKDRLIRQKHMNDRATFNIFNIGGAGTLEEVAITLCSQKLHKNVPTPMIFVDPLGLGGNGQHLWAKLQDIVVDLAEKKMIAGNGHGEYNVQLLQPFMANFLHVVSSYDEAADIIEKFAADPVTYYAQTARIPFHNLQLAYEQSEETYEETYMNLPVFLDPEKVLDEKKWLAIAASSTLHKT